MTGALPGYSAFEQVEQGDLLRRYRGDTREVYGRYTGDIREILLEQVEQGDLLRAVTAYAAVAGDAPMWQQVISPLDLP